MRVDTTKIQSIHKKQWFIGVNISPNRSVSRVESFSSAFFV